MSESREMKSAQSSVVNTGKAGVRYRQEALEAFYEGFKAAGIDFAVYLPDSMLDGIEQLMIERGGDRKSTRLNSSHSSPSRMPSSA